MAVQETTEEQELGEAVAEETSQFLSFVVDNEYFGLELLAVHEILKPVPITRVPNVENYILGVINLRGEIIPILDLKKRFDLGNTDLSPTSRFIVIMENEKRIGIFVDEVKQVLKVPESCLSYTTDELHLSYGRLIDSVSRMNEQLILNLDIEQLVGFVKEG
ncbi:MAG: purine-binding chemotaxis protein CheW [Leptospira sp.]|nr:purine-binding chemotaxis protein CheW [Leptospira sp.]